MDKIFQKGQMVWIRRSAEDKPRAAHIQGLIGRSSTNNLVYEFKYVGGGWSGCADYDIYETEDEAKNARK